MIIFKYKYMVYLNTVVVTHDQRFQLIRFQKALQFKIQ